MVSLQRALFLYWKSMVQHKRSGKCLLLFFRKRMENTALHIPEESFQFEFPEKALPAHYFHGFIHRIDTSIGYQGFAGKNGVSVFIFRLKVMVVCNSDHILQ